MVSLVSVELFRSRRKGPWCRDCHESAQLKIADVMEHPGVFNHAGLLVNGPPGTAGLPFI